MVGWILPDVMTKDTLMSKKIGFGKGQDFLIFGSTAGLRLTCISQHRTSLKIIQDCQINLALFSGKTQQMFHSLQGLTSNISPCIFWITTLSSGNKGASLPAIVPRSQQLDLHCSATVWPHPPYPTYAKWQPPHSSLYVGLFTGVR